MFDAYTLRARVMPAGMAAAPPLTFLVGNAFLTEPIETASPLGLLLLAIAFIGALVSRSRGRKLQPELWRSWGGSPTVQLLRWRDSDDPERTGRLHARVSQLVDVPVPTAADEQSDPDTADHRYEEAIHQLRELTRGGEYPLVADANADYGFRRNLLGLKPAGMAIAAATAIASLCLLIDTGKLLLLLPASIGIIALSLWSTVVRGQWVRKAADDYARHLLAATTLLVRAA